MEAREGIKRRGCLLWTGLIELASTQDCITSWDTADQGSGPCVGAREAGGVVALVWALVVSQDPITSDVWDGRKPSYDSQPHRLGRAPDWTARRQNCTYL